MCAGGGGGHARNVEREECIERVVPLPETQLHSLCVRENGRPWVRGPAGARARPACRRRPEGYPHWRSRVRGRAAYP